MIQSFGVSFQLHMASIAQKGSTQINSLWWVRWIGVLNVVKLLATYQEKAR